jgi:hypothetical protein
MLALLSAYAPSRNVKVSPRGERAEGHLNIALFPYE